MKVAGHKPYVRSVLRAQQNGLCFYCRKPMTPARHRGNPRAETLDHVVPRSQGGKWKLSNLVLACAECNVAKSNKSFEDFVIEMGLMKMAQEA